ncbi:hypothetical protein SLEP1_g14062 [Rubroshorea leprosula]|uniref:Uncharacterized protein n=1 Tax=Rubroshorea leprosula TaxID=152421 RepID=A0AAV5INS8_9ROSI|nr:hypothetical protein SLEP1_g14062 [Rubroshorea leprosula]
METEAIFDPPPKIPMGIPGLAIGKDGDGNGDGIPALVGTHCHPFL